MNSDPSEMGGERSYDLEPRKIQRQSIDLIYRPMSWKLLIARTDPLAHQQQTELEIQKGSYQICASGAERILLPEWCPKGADLWKCALCLRRWQRVANGRWQRE